MEFMPEVAPVRLCLETRPDARNASGGPPKVRGHCQKRFANATAEIPEIRPILRASYENSGVPDTMRDSRDIVPAAF
jgi:hypothetical protein